MALSILFRCYRFSIAPLHVFDACLVAQRLTLKNHFLTSIKSYRILSYLIPSCPACVSPRNESLLFAKGQKHAMVFSQANKIETAI